MEYFFENLCLESLGRSSEADLAIGFRLSGLVIFCLESVVRSNEADLAIGV
jgi:hypothetical protein